MSDFIRGSVSLVVLLDLLDGTASRGTSVSKWSGPTGVGITLAPIGGDTGTVDVDPKEGWEG